MTVKKVDSAVKVYNEDKPHSSLQSLTPEVFEEKFIKSVLENKSKDEESIDKKVR